ncbi:MAG: TraR/DksA family transcriptional regulator [Bryobacteraceae bacterium]
MTHSDLARFQRALEAKQEELSQSSGLREDIRIERAADELDSIQNAAIRDLAVVQLHRDAGLLRQVEAAMARIANQSYGICLDCDGDISRNRLMALPWATLCIRCQEQADASGDVEDPASFDDSLASLALAA